MVSGSVSGGLRADFGFRVHGITGGENRPLGWHVAVPGGFADSFDGWGIDLFVLHSLGPNGVDELAAAAVLQLNADHGLALDAPDIIWVVRDEDWVTLGVAPREWWYELWRTDAGHRYRLARGRIEVGQ